MRFMVSSRNRPVSSSSYGPLCRFIILERYLMHGPLVLDDNREFDRADLG